MVNIMVEQTQEQNELIDASDINELEEIFAAKTGLPAPPPLLLVKKEKKKEEEKKLPEQTLGDVAVIVEKKLAKIIPIQNQPIEPTQQIEQKQESTLTQPLSSEILIQDVQRPSFDSMIARAIKVKQDKVADQVYDKIYQLVELATSDAPILTPTYQQPQVQVIEKEKVVYSNDEVIKRIDNKLLDPNVRGKNTLLNLKNELQGLEPFVNVPIKESWFTKNSKSIATVLGLVALGMIVVGAIA